jgi:cell division protein FtsB
MSTAESILVITLAAFLALFLFLSIILVANLIKLTKKLQEVADKAHQIVDNVENVADIFKRSAGPFALGRFFMNLVETVTKHKKEK